MTRVLAVQYVRRMRGGAQAHLLRCSDGEYYVVKFQNNPQGSRILANELLGTLLAKRLSLPTAASAIVDVREELIRNSEEMVIQLGRNNTACCPGACFGSRFPSEADVGGNVIPLPVYDFLSEDRLTQVSNLRDFLGMLVFDKFTCNSDGRQVVFVRASAAKDYEVRMIDNGFCFNAHQWSFPDAPL